MGWVRFDREARDEETEVRPALQAGGETRHNNSLLTKTQGTPAGKFLSWGQGRKISLQVGDWAL